MKQKFRYRNKQKGGGLLLAWPAGSTPEEVAAKATYGGSAEHKLRPLDPAFSFLPDLRSDASKCDSAITLQMAERSLKASILARCVSADFEGGFPRYAWATLDGTYYQARLINSGKGEYKGWPIAEYEVPVGAADRLAGSDRDV